MPDWLQLRASSPDPTALESALEEAGALAITWEDAGDSPVLEPAPGETPVWPDARLTALFDADTDGAALLDTLESRGLIRPGDAVLETLADRAWERECLRDFVPMRFGHRLWVCPHGDATPLPDEAIALRLDPGLAFGTGTHPTTRLCLEWLDAQPLAGRHVIDYGCGSGILAIAAALLGAAQVVAVDHDPQALQATRDNAARNGVADRIEILSSDAPPPAAADIVIANILAGTLISLAGPLLTLLKPDGDLVLSGVLAEQEPAVARAFADEIRFSVANSEAWIRLDGRRFASG